MKRMYLRKRKKIPSIIIVIALVSFFTSLIYYFYYKSCSDKLISVASIMINDEVSKYLSNNIGYEIFKSDELADIIVIDKNSEGEILYVSFNLNKAYETLDIVTNKLSELMSNIDKNTTSDTIVSFPSGMALELPLFIASNNVLASSLGPKIYVPISFVGSIITNLRSEVTNYGLNNALLELYVTIKITTNLVTPLKEGSKVIEYDVLISSTVINGRVPSVYNGLISNESSEFSLPIN